MTDDPAGRIAELSAQIRGHEHAYFVDDAPTVDDATYDGLLRELRALEEAHPELVTADSPTQRVGGGLREGLVEVRHLQPMLSLANARNEDELVAWDERVRRLLGRGRHRRGAALRDRAEDRRRWRSRCCTATGGSSAAPRAATARWART